MAVHGIKIQVYYGILRWAWVKASVLLSDMAVHGIKIQVYYSSIRHGHGLKLLFYSKIQLCME